MSIPRPHPARIQLFAATIALLLALTLGIIPATAQGRPAARITISPGMISNSPAVDLASPPASATIEEYSEAIASGPLSPLNLIAAAIAACVTVIGIRVWNDRPRGRLPSKPAIDPPGDLPPAVAGALALGYITYAQITATILDLARRGALAIGPETDVTVRIRLLDDSIARAEFERRLWDVLEAQANERRVITSKRMLKIVYQLEPAQDALRHDLQARGWFSRDAAKRRRPAVLVGVVALLLGAAAFLLAGWGQQNWGLLGAGLLGVAGLGALVNAFAIPDTTLDGERHAQPWRDYLKGLQGAQDTFDVDLDRALPYALAMGTEMTLDGQLRAASEQGYQPAWFGKQTTDILRNRGFYRYFRDFKSRLTPRKPPT